MKKEDLEFGVEVQDVVTGTKGVITGVADYMTGCSRVMMEMPGKDGAPGQTDWIDIIRLKRTRKKKIDLPEAVANPGGPGDNPSFSDPS